MARGDHLPGRRRPDHHGRDHFLTAFQANLGQQFHAANDDPKFQGLSWTINDPGYVTSLPGTRAAAFYNAADADPNVIAADDNATPFSDESLRTEAGKDVVPSGQFDALGLLFSTGTQAIQVPVLIIIGSQDRVFCGPDGHGGTFDCSSGEVIAQQEAPYYSPQAQLEACSVPRLGSRNHPAPRVPCAGGGGDRLALPFHRPERPVRRSPSSTRVRVDRLIGAGTELLRTG